MTDEKINARGFPKTYYARHMESGLCGYENEKILVDADAMKAMCPSFQGKPVYVGHQKVNVDNIQAEADGYVTECFYNPLDGWLWAKMLVVSDKANDAIGRGWAVSNAYIPQEFSSGGQHHNVDFNRKIVNAMFTHLAIVPDPRYEGASIMTPEQYKSYCADKQAQLDELQNNKGKSKMSFKRFFKKTEEEIKTVDGLTDDAMVELQNGKSVSLKTLIDDHVAAEAAEAAAALENAKTKKNSDKDKEKEDDEDFLNSDTEVDVGGKKMKVGELANRYMNRQKKNSEDEEKAKKEKEEKENAEDDKKKEEDEKKNAKHFDELKNARTKAAAPVVVDTSIDQVQRGKDLYGSGK